MQKGWRKERNSENYFTFQLKWKKKRPNKNTLDKPDNLGTVLFENGVNGDGARSGKRG